VRRLASASLWVVWGLGAECWVLAPVVRRALSIKSTPVSLVLESTRGKSYLINLIDTPGMVRTDCWMLLVREVWDIRPDRSRSRIPLGRYRTWAGGVDHGYRSDLFEPCAVMVKEGDIRRRSNDQP
jgi:hypothetical protein